MYYPQLTNITHNSTFLSPKILLNAEQTGGSLEFIKNITAEKVEDVNMPSCVAEQRVCFPNTPHKPKQNIERDNTIHYSVQALAQDIMPNNTPNSRMQTVMSVLSRKTETLKPSGDKRGECITSMLHMLYIMIF